MNTAFKTFLVLCLGALIYSCQKEISGDSGVIPVGPQPAFDVTATVSGRIVDEHGEPVKGAVVSAGNTTATTDLNGAFTISGAKLKSSAALIRVEKAGYFGGSRTFMARENQHHYVEIQLVPKVIVGNISATSGGKIDLLNGSAITLPANGVVVASTGAAYSGNVLVSMAWLDPTSPDLFRRMPGDLRGIDQSSRENTLVSYGMLAVELHGPGGEKLQMAAGKKASLKFPLPSAIVGTAPATVPLWSFDENTGLWKQEGTATKNGNAYLGDVSHFSFWNCDAPFLNVNFSVIFKDQNGKPLVNRLIRIKRSGPANGIVLTTYAFTDSTGYVGGRVPQNEALQLEVLGSYTCMQTLYSQNIGPFAPNSNANLGVVTVNTGTINHFVLTGSVINCSGSPVTDGFVSVITPGGVYKAVVNNGTFMVNFSGCTASETITYFAVDISASQQSAAVTTTINAGTPTNLGVVNACGTSTNEFIDVTFGGTTYALKDSLSGMAWTFQIPMTNISGNKNSSGVYLNINALGQAVGNFTIDNMDLHIGTNKYYNSAVPSTITFTEYGAVNQFISGSASGLLRDSSGIGTYNFSCNFRVRRIL